MRKHLGSSRPARPDTTSMDIAENPYASPLLVEPERGVDAIRRATVRTFRCLGWAGIVYISLLLLIAFPFVLVEGPPRFGVITGMMVESAVFLAFFAFVIRTAGRLGVDLTGTYRRARWVAILAATVFFPVLTIPGILALRRLERYRSHMVEPLRGET